MTKEEAKLLIQGWRVELIRNVEGLRRLYLYADACEVAKHAEALAVALTAMEEAEEDGTADCEGKR